MIDAAVSAEEVAMMTYPSPEWFCRYRESFARFFSAPMAEDKSSMRSPGVIAALFAKQLRRAIRITAL